MKKGRYEAEEISILMGHSNKGTTQDLLKSTSPKFINAADSFD